MVKSPNILSFEYISKNWKIILNKIQTERPSISAMLEDYSPTRFDNNTLFIKSESSSAFNEKILNTTKFSKRPIIIFPQATRTPIDDRIPFKKGVSKIYEKLNFLCLPVALNSGDVWEKFGKLLENFWKTNLH